MQGDNVKIYLITKTLMQDTKNLLKKRDIYYPKMIMEFREKWDKQNAEYWERELKWLIERIKRRKKNWDKNIKAMSKWQWHK